MLNPLWLLFSIVVWLKKTISLPKLYEMVLFDKIDVICFTCSFKYYFNNDNLCADIDYNYFNDSQSADNNQCSFRRSCFGRRLNYLRRFDDYV